ncbi:hypothetical protein IT6_08985 [Methylacidiphilum caldifontis]|uniref:hypothetical protein n=1 Tax=Methylacidiphilum caldifontis TaxID=2795386 RepID=UPI001A8D13EB|nr:hypothetical protein [Methylacidiphilum caldifontis]QSR88489.1 hypothetical protein IT6_08985 [Methylacidiphilum caldifontis]
MPPLSAVGISGLQAGEDVKTLGRGKALVQFRNWGFNGFIAWIVWLLIHIITLISFRNRLSVLIQWAWAYLRFKPGARLLSK